MAILASLTSKKMTPKRSISVISNQNPKYPSSASSPSSMMTKICPSISLASKTINRKAKIGLLSLPIRKWSKSGFTCSKTKNLKGQREVQKRKAVVEKAEILSVLQNQKLCSRSRSRSHQKKIRQWLSTIFHKDKECQYKIRNNKSWIWKVHKTESLWIHCTVTIQYRVTYRKSQSTIKRNLPNRKGLLNLSSL